MSAKGSKLLGAVQPVIPQVRIAILKSEPQRQNTVIV